MKILIYLKDPDAVSDALDEAVRNSILPLMGVLSKEELDQLAETRMDEIGNKIEKWVKYGEYITVEIDTDLRTARVVEV